MKNRMKTMKPSKPLNKLSSFCLSLIFAQNIFAANSTATKAVEPDNTGINKRDDSVVEMTAQDQSNNPAEIAITRKIRAEINKTKSLSTYAKNIKIITKGNMVILKGPVRSTDEINTINQTAAKIAGDYKIQNDLEVAKNDNNERDTK